MELRWPATLQDASGAIKRPLFEIQQSADLIHWQSLGKAFRAEANAPALSQLLPRSETQYFYRLAARMDDTFVGSSGEDVFGYTEQVQEAWGQIGSIPPQEFQSRYDWPAGHYLDALHWDPARCVNWTTYMPVAGEDVAYDPAPPTFPPRAPNIVHFRLNVDSVSPPFPRSSAPSHLFSPLYSSQRGTRFQTAGAASPE